MGWRVLPCLVACWICLGGFGEAGEAPSASVRLSVTKERFPPAEGPFVGVAVDSSESTIYVVSPSRLCPFRNGELLRDDIEECPSADCRLLLAPRGRVLAWLSSHPTERGHLRARIGSVEGGPLTELRMDGQPYGFGTLHVGYRGEILATEQRIAGEDAYRQGSRFVFWSRDGVPSRPVDLPRRPRVIVDRTAPALLLLEENAASAYTPNGEDLWKRDGRFGLGAMSGGGTLALLRPADPGRLDQVHVCRKKQDSDREVEVDIGALPWPVMSLRIAPDGRSALVLGAEGRYALLDLESLRASEEKRLSFPESVWISDADFVGDGTLVFGVLLSSEPYPKPDWTKAAVVAVTREGERIFEQELILREAYAGVPSVEVADGGNAFAAYTRENVIHVEIKS